MKINLNNPYYIKARKRESQFREGYNDYDGGLPKEVIFYQNRKKYGNSNIDDIKYLKSLGVFQKGLSIGSGGGMFELNLIKEGIVGEFIFLDISQKAHNTLNKNAIELGVEDRIKTEIQDFNFLKIERDSYDFISCQNILHHLINLEEALFEINKGLTPEGIFILEDFIGEKKMYRSDTKMKIIETVQTFLKERYNIKTNRFIRTNPNVLTNNCPFECVRSNELYGILQHYFGDTKIIESSFGHIFASRGGILIDNSEKSFEVLEIFDKFVSENNLVSPQRIFGIYRKSDKQLLKTNSRSEEEIKKNIKINLINEKFLIKIGIKITKKMPGLASLLKKIYFVIRKWF